MPEQNLQQQLEDVQAVNAHLREQLFAIQARRVRMQGYLFQFNPYPTGIFSSAWEKRYFSLVESCLKCFASEETMAQIPETELFVQGYSLHWEGKKKKKYFIFGLKDAASCVTLRLSTEDRPTALSWMTALEAAGATGRETRHIPRIQSLPSRWSSLRRDSSGEAIGAEMDLPDIVESPKAEKHQRRGSMVGSTPVHVSSRSSVLSSERLFQHPHPGLLNLGAVILLAANFRLVLENVFKYGLRVNPLRWVTSFFLGSSQPLVLCWPVIAVCALSTYGIECLAVQFLRRYEGSAKRGDTSNPSPGDALVPLLHTMNLLICFLLPLLLVYISTEGMMASFVVTMTTVVVCMKLVSYVHCNADLRHARIMQEEREPSSEDSTITYPSNITPYDFSYFLAAPTLTYQISFPRTDRIRGRWLLRRIGELALALALLVAIIDQYIFPAVENSMQTMENRDFIALLERILKLSLPVVYAWLTMFYIVFHLWLNILAEALKFGDREFYLDWWNALNLGDYWKTWNMPVHKWMLRTIYYPVIRRGLSRSTAMLLVFFVSALMHEVVVIVPLKFTNHFPWSFCGMMFQVPLILFSQFLQKRFGDRWGNIIFWVSFCVVGQPICLLNYYYDWIHALQQR